MKKVYQTILAGGDGFRKRGNCTEACIASLLNVELHEVPILENFGNKWRDAVKLFFKSKELVLEFDSLGPNNEYFIVEGYTERDTKHCCIYDREDQLIHDPHPNNTGLITKDLFWIVTQKIEFKSAGNTINWEPITTEFDGDHIPFIKKLNFKAFI